MIRKSFDPVVVKAHRRSEDVEGEYRLKRDINGTVSYVKIGERSVSEYVNSFAKGCSLRSILERCALMPLRDKVVMLNQTEQGIEVDLTGVPKDLTEAFINAQNLAKDNPEISKRLRSGESMNDIVKDIVSAEVKVKEDINNGKDEPSND